MFLLQHAEWNKWPKPLCKSSIIAQSPVAEIEVSWPTEDQGRIISIYIPSSCITVHLWYSYIYVCIFIV